MKIATTMAVVVVVELGLLYLFGHFGDDVDLQVLSSQMPFLKDRFFLKER